MLEEEAGEFPEVVKWYENLCKEKFGAIKFNYIIIFLGEYYEKSCSSWNL